MSAPFDPYYKWLGVPPAQQPADHYRFLGIERGEADVEVIAAAVRRTALFLKDVLEGPHSPEARKLLGELAAIQRCLRTAAQKAEYDRSLGLGATEVAENAADPAAETTPPEKSTDEQFPWFDLEIAEAGAADGAPTSDAQDARTPETGRRARRTPNRAVTAAGLAFCAGALGMILGVTWNGGSLFDLARRPAAPEDVHAPPPLPDEEALSREADAIAAAEAAREAALQPAVEEAPPAAPRHVVRRPATPQQPPEDTKPAALPTRDLYVLAERQVDSGRLAEATPLLRKYLEQPAAPRRAEAIDLLDQIRRALSKKDACALLVRLDSQDFEEASRGQLSLARLAGLARPALKQEFARTVAASVDDARRARRELLAQAENDSLTEASGEEPVDEPTPLVAVATAARGTLREDGVSPDGGDAEEAPAAVPSTPAEALTAFGLTKRGSQWLLAAETKLPKQAASLGELERKFQKARLQSTETLNRFASLRAQWLDSMARRQRLFFEGRIVPVDLMQFIARWRGQLDTPNTVAQIPEVQKALADFNLAHDELSLAVVKLKAEIAAIEKQYAELGKNAAVTAALEKLGPPRQQLGPGDDLARTRGRFKKIDPLVFGDQLPAVPVEGGVEIHAILNEKVIVPMVFRPESPFTCLPAKSLTAAGIEVPADAPEARLMFGPAAPPVIARTIKVDSLRLGGCLLTNVEVHALPDDADAVGAILSAQSFDGQHPEVDLGRFLVTIVPLR